ncbi:MAG: CTP synthase, partial [Coriobacteriia bacterium]|nr:CTP synthase [Coriobacteriia bacterium]
GLQVAVCEFARNKAGMPDANSTEFAEDLGSLQYPVIDIMPEQEDIHDMGGTMRLGSYPTKLHPSTLAHSVYGSDLIYERHRHRYEVNNAYRDQLQEAGLVVSGLSPDDRLVENIELPREVHPYFIATQAHPEFKSRPTKPHPLFVGLIDAAIKVNAQKNR